MHTFGYLFNTHAAKWLESILMVCYFFIASYMQSDCIIPKRIYVPDKLLT